MATGAFGMSGKEQLSLTAVQCLIQGILISLLGTFLSTRSTRPPSFTVYVIIINLLCLGQTAISFIQTMDVLDTVPYRESLLLANAIHTVVIGTCVQAFFVHRCWKILKKRLLPAVLLVSLVLTGLTAGVLIVIYKVQLTAAYLACQENPQDGALLLALQAADRHMRIALTVWAFSWFVLDLGMTVITTVFLYRARTGLPAHDGIFRTVWQVLWTSVIPPLIIMAIIIIDGYVTPGSPTAASRITVGIAAKFLALSLMINLVGQGLIREKFDRSRPSPLSLPPTRPGAIISEALFARDIESLGSPQAENRHSICDTSSTKYGSLRAEQDQEGDAEKYPMPTTPLPIASSHISQQIRFSG